MNTTGERLKMRFTRPVFLWAITAMAAEFLVQFCIEAGWRSPFPRLFLLLPLIPCLFFVVALLQGIWKMDELQKRICLESAFIAFLLTLGLTFVFTGMERLGIYRATFDDTGTAMLFFWACAYIVFSRRYR